MIQVAANYAASIGAPLYFPSSNYKITSTIVVTNWLSLRGDGELTTTLWGWRLNDAIVRAVSAAAVYRPHVNGLKFRSYFEAGATHTASAGLNFSGDASWVQHGSIRNLIFAGMQNGIVNDKATVTTSFGQEGTLAWMTFDNFEFLEEERKMQPGFRFTASGTGNVFSKLKGIIMGASASFMNFGEPGKCGRGSRDLGRSLRRRVGRDLRPADSGWLGLPAAHHLRGLSVGRQL